MKRLTDKTIIVSIVFALVLTWTGLALAGVRASLSQGRVALGDSFTLNLDVSGKSGGAAPDLSVLNKDFRVDGTGQTSTTNVINGAVSQSHGWQISLTPKRKGTLAIPAIKVGTEASKPLSIDVVEPAKLPRANLAKNGIEVTMSVPKGTFYVQQEIPVTVRVVTSEALRDAQLFEPSSPDILVTQSGTDKSSRDVVDGRQVSVIERTFLVKPQKSGELVLPPATLRGTVTDPNARRSPFGAGSVFEEMRRQFGNAGFGGSLFDDFMNPGREVVARSQALTLDIKARPGQAANNWFLPAKNVKLVAQWKPAKPSFKVGEATSRIVQIVAKGVSKEQLPDLKFDNADGARIYVDRVDDRSVDTDNGTVAIKQYTLSIVPTRAGDVTLPAVKVGWLDTANGKQKTAELPATLVKVAPGAAFAASPQPPAAAPTPASVAARQATTPPAATADAWPTAILVGALCGVGAILVLWWGRRRQSVQPQTAAMMQPGRARNREADAQVAAAALRKACRQNDAGQAFARLKDWFVAAGVDPQALPSASATAFRGAMQDLESSLYSVSPGGAWDGGALLAAFEALRGEMAARSGHPARTGDLPPLYTAGERHDRAA